MEQCVLPDGCRIATFILSVLFWGKKTCNEFMSGAFTTALFKGHTCQGFHGSVCHSIQLWQHCLLSPPNPVMHLLLEPPWYMDTSQHASMAEDDLITFPGLSSSQTRGEYSNTHSNNNIPSSLCCSASLMMQSLQGKLPPKMDDP